MELITIAEAVGKTIKLSERRVGLGIAIVYDDNSVTILIGDGNCDTEYVLANETLDFYKSEFKILRNL